MKPRTRFAPSPTGPLHMGGVRTALFCFLFARRHEGTMILRIEDTDQSRYVPGAEEYIMESLAWCGIEIDEGVREGGEYGPYRQSERKEIYQQYANQLIESGWGYYAFDTNEELERARAGEQWSGGAGERGNKGWAYDGSTRMGMRNSLTLSKEEVDKLIEGGAPYVIRFKFPENEEIVMQDLIRGEVIVNTNTLDDKVLFKSDGMPTYHLANVVDDHLMKISHVIRGEEWLPSLPLHVMLYKAFGWTETMPEFAHLPLILKPAGNGKLSKRDGDKLGFPVFPINWQSPDSEDIYSGYRETGYLPEAFVNMLALLGWNPGTEQEIFSLDELIQAFSLDRVGKSGSRFDPEKARSTNHAYIQGLTNTELSALVLQGTQVNSGQFRLIQGEVERERLEKVCGLVKERMVLLTDFWDQAYFFFEAPVEYDEKMVRKGWKDSSAGILEGVVALLKGIQGTQGTQEGSFQSPVSSFKLEDLEEGIKGWISENELGMGAVMNPLRLAMVGAPKGPGVFEIMDVLGPDEVIRRIERAIKVLG